MFVGITGSLLWNVPGANHGAVFHLGSSTVWR